MSVQSEEEYEDLLAQWADLESALSLLLHHPAAIAQPLQRLAQLDRWLRDLLDQQADLGLYLLFQLAGRSPTGYSSSHALMCAVLCHLLAQAYALTEDERRALVGAALTMNLGMTRVQDELATQREAPSASQKQIIQVHPERGHAALQAWGVADPLWLDIVASHHADIPAPANPLALPTPGRLTHILQVVDRYAALISPRQTREGRSAAESLGALAADAPDSVGNTLLRVVGRYPPGTFVTLHAGEIAVVTRRSNPGLLAAIILDARGHTIKPPRLMPIPDPAQAIARPARVSPVHERINHHSILQLAAATS